MSKINSTRYCYGKTEMQSFANIFKGTEWIHLDFLVRKKKEESTLLNTFVPPYDDINEMFLFLKVFVSFSRRIINYCLSNCFTSFLFFGFLMQICGVFSDIIPFQINLDLKLCTYYEFFDHDMYFYTFAFKLHPTEIVFCLLSHFQYPIIIS